MFVACAFCNLSMKVFRYVIFCFVLLLRCCCFSCLGQGFVTEWPSFRKELFTRLTFVILVVTHFGFDGRTLVLSAPLLSRCYFFLLLVQIVPVAYV